MAKIRTFLALSLLLQATVSFCAVTDPLSDAVKDLGYIAGSPGRINAASIYPVVGIIGAGLVLYSFDGQIRNIAQKNRTKTLDDVSKQAEKLGNGGYDLAISGIGALAGHIFSDEKLKRTSFLAIESFLAANTVGTVSKFAIGRSRPYTGDSKNTFHPFNTKTSRTAMPSGHTVSAFSAASVYAYNYGGSSAVGIAAYGLAGLVALQRVYADKHWASDAFFGAALGTAVGRMVAAKGAAPVKKLALLPVYSGDYAGLTATYRF